MSDNNFPKVTIEDFKEIIKAQFIENNFRPIFGLGKGGIGKTESIIELSKEMNIGYIDIRLLLYNETDLKGIPYPDANHVSTIWLQNNILPNAQRDGEKGILVFDEITSCSKSVRTAAYQLLNERKLGEYILPSGWMIVCLGNGPDDGGDFNGMEGNFLNRCSVYDIIPSIPAWCNWAVKAGINPLVVAYIRFKGDDFHTFNPDADMELFASPRSWKAVSDILDKNGDIDNRFTQLRVMGNLGASVADTFISFCQLKTSAIKPEDIIMGRFYSDKENAYNFSNRESLVITVNSLVKELGDLIRLNNGIAQIGDDTITKFAFGIDWLINLNVDGGAELKLISFKDLSNIDQSTLIRLIMSPKFIAICKDYPAFASHYSNLLNR